MRGWGSGRWKKSGVGRRGDNTSGARCKPDSEFGNCLVYNQVLFGRLVSVRDVAVLVQGVEGWNRLQHGGSLERPVLALFFFLFLSFFFFFKAEIVVHKQQSGMKLFYLWRITVVAWTWKELENVHLRRIFFQEGVLFLEGFLVVSFDFPSLFKVPFIVLLPYRSWSFWWLNSVIWWSGDSFRFLVHYVPRVSHSLAPFRQ